MRPTACTFDCYGTLVDWEGGLGTFLYSLALREGDPAPDPGRVMRERWEAIQFEVIGGEYRPYKQVLAESLRAWCEERGYAFVDPQGEGLVRAMRDRNAVHDT